MLQNIIFLTETVSSQPPSKKLAYAHPGILASAKYTTIYLSIFPNVHFKTLHKHNRFYDVFFLNTPDKSTNSRSCTFGLKNFCDALLKYCKGGQNFVLRNL